ncbi:hypothetical protein LZ554_004408 [Drepanopeziza brunnea f. sp. 'monogermtubi']|nr:hypothetical protein LZ554_004408 [Drepanopeziza brunnea f. sp. 'monogermtubi']
MLRSESILATLLALSFFFNGAQAFLGIHMPGTKVIGYATVPRELALRMNEDNFVFPEKNSPRLGPGFSLLNDPSLLRNTATSGDWYCAVKAKKGKVKKVGKIYIPWYYIPINRPVFLWNGVEKEIKEYVVTFRSLKKPFDALRFGWAQDLDRKMHMLIPASVVRYGNLGLWGKCFETEDELRDFSDEVIDWGNKKEWDILGVY